jgi:hypothetical protein
MLSGSPMGRGPQAVGPPAPRGPEIGPPAGFNVSEWLAILNYSMALANWLADQFSGRPKFLDTAEAIQRLAQSQFWQMRALAANLEIWLRNGVPLSTSDPRLQAQLRDWIHGALSSLGLTQAQILTVDTILWRVLASETALSANYLDQVILAFQRANLVPPPPPPPPPIPPPPPPPKGVPLGVISIPQQVPRPGPTPFGQPGPSPFTPSRPQSQSHIASQVAGCTALALINPAFAARCLETLAVQVVEQGAREIIDNALRLIRGQGGRPAPISPPVSQLGGGNHSGIHVDVTQDCPSCAQAAKQRGQLQRDIRVELGQQQEQQFEQTQQEIERLEHLETQPAGQRDITRELQRKQELLRELDQIQQTERQVLAQSQQTTPHPQPGQVPHVEVPPSPNPLVQICHDQCAGEDPEHYEKCIDACWSRQGQPLSAHHIQFCMACASNEDAISFLNGEQAQCSVLPGSTKEVS